MMKRILSTDKSKVFVSILIVTIAVLLVVLFSNYTVKSESLPCEQKLYKSIMVESGDTLWDIAEEYCIEGESMIDYLEELKAINGIHDGNVKSGCYIVVSYILDEDCDEYNNE